MKIEKIQKENNLYKLDILYYQKARDAMYDIVNQLFLDGYENIFIPGYIGWSHKEGSGIFDPLNRISGLNREYYKMTSDLQIDVDDLMCIVKPHSIVLLVNYFGFRDRRIKETAVSLHDRDCIVIEDNAHGFYTYFCNDTIGVDYTFFSLHKMFPFSYGGALLCEEGKLDMHELHGKSHGDDINPFNYNIFQIANKRKDNYKILYELLENHKEYVVPLREIEWLDENIPQTFPIIIKRGNRNEIYDLMNDNGFGVVSLYHTMIEELRNERYKDSTWLSQRIMNLPVHQDCNSDYYKEMIVRLIESCKETEET